MVALCLAPRLAYFPVPKNACTSIKLALFEIDHGYDIHDKVGPDPENRFVHVVLRSDAFWEGVAFSIPPGFLKVTVVRDPIQRFVSGYRNRIVHLGEAREAGPGLPRQPDIDTFIRLLPEYMRTTPMIAHHFAPQVGYVGHDLGWYDRVFSVSRLSEMETFLSERTGRTITLGRSQDSGPRISADDLSPAARDTLRQYYAEDYRLFQRFPGFL